MWVRLCIVCPTPVSMSWEQCAKKLVRLYKHIHDKDKSVFLLHNRMNSTPSMHYCFMVTYYILHAVLLGFYQRRLIEVCCRKLFSIVLCIPVTLEKITLSPVIKPFVLWFLLTLLCKCDVCLNQSRLLAVDYHRLLLLLY